MTHWMKGVFGCVMNRLARRAPTTERRGSSRKVKGVSTVEYALILVAVVAIVGGGMAALDDEFKALFNQVQDDITAKQNAVKAPDIQDK